MKIRIYYHDTDCGGVVYYANYLKYMEEARTEFLEQRGIYIKELVKQGTGFVVARQEIDYKFPAFYGDILQVDAKLTNTSEVKLEFVCEAKNQDGKLVCIGKTIMVCVDLKNLRPTSIPQDLREKCCRDRVL